jgi:pimeloyl-ACP methyl ester carboxylesterase
VTLSHGSDHRVADVIAKADGGSQQQESLRRSGYPAGVTRLHPASLRTLRPLALVTVLVAGALVACTAPLPSAGETSTRATASSADSGTLAWSACDGGFDCATLTVPLSYDDPEGPSLDIAVTRLRASGERLGAIVLNPGGPGGSGVDYAQAATIVTSDALRTHYDIVGFDPRGVNRSTPVECLTGPQIDALLAADGTPDSPQEEAQVAGLSGDYAVGCQTSSPDLFGHIGTVDVVRDMDRLREALGEDQLDYIGKSYGTFLGITYAEMFPKNVGRFVLDGVLPPDLDLNAITQGQAIGFENALRRFVEDCDPRPDCPLPDGTDAGVARIQQFFADLEANPLPAQSDRPLNEALATYAVLMHLYLPEYDWPVLRQGLTAAFAGDGRVFLDALDQRMQRSPDGTYGDNSTEAFYAITCLDHAWDGGAAAAARLGAQWAVEAPTFGEYLAWGNLPCDDWPVPAQMTPHAVTDPAIPPMLIVSTRWDPATPYDWGVKVAEMLPGARLLTWEGDGHTAYRHGSGCVDETVDAFLIDGTLPESDVICD